MVAASRGCTDNSSLQPATITCNLQPSAAAKACNLQPHLQPVAAANHKRIIKSSPSLSTFL
jgi:hypothetical protein